MQGIVCPSMNSVTSSAGALCRSLRLFACLVVLAAAPLVSLALTPVSFAPLHDQVANEIATLSAIAHPTPAQRARLRTLNRAGEILADTSKSDGKALLLLTGKLQTLRGYRGALNTVASNLVAVYNNEYDFVGALLLELPTTDEAKAVEAQFNRLHRPSLQLNRVVTGLRVGTLYDSAKRRLDTVFFHASEALFIPFPDDLPVNSVSAKVNGVNFLASAGLATENLFEAIATPSNIVINVSAVDLPRGLLLSVPNAQPGSFRYAMPDAASFVNRTAIYSPTESSTAATNGAIYMSTTATEVYGSFRCSGLGFEIRDGRFRINISSTP